jgi:hypothetical protein
MANNRMVLVCNKCNPTDDWVYGDDVCHIGKWYPIGDYVSKPNEVLGQLINEFLERHAHTEDVENNIPDAIIHNENPIRLTYESWVRDMPAIKKWTPHKES